MHIQAINDTGTVIDEITLRRETPTV